MSNGTWVDIKSGGKVLRLWETKGGPPPNPEVAILQLSGAQYKAFTKDPVGFLNSNGIFPVDVNKIVAQSTITPKSEGDRKGSDNWMVMVEHEWTSNCATAAMLLFEPKPKEAY
jgi:hypothetical protein